MNAREVYTKERILMIRMVYSVLKEKMEEDECGWFYDVSLQFEHCFCC
jgi:hypothetical protein